MDNSDLEIVSFLRNFGRASITEIATALGLSRATVRTRMRQLERRGDILGYTVVLKEDSLTHAVRGQMMVEIEGRGSDRIIKQVAKLAAVKTIYTTNGRWDLIMEIGTDSLEEFDAALFDIRSIEGITSSETSLLLSTRKLTKLALRVADSS